MQQTTRGKCPTVRQEMLQNQIYSKLSMILLGVILLCIYLTNRIPYGRASIFVVIACLVFYWYYMRKHVGKFSASAYIAQQAGETPAQQLYSEIDADLANPQAACGGCYIGRQWAYCNTFIRLENIRGFYFYNRKIGRKTRLLISVVDWRGRDLLLSGSQQKLEQLYQALTEWFPDLPHGTDAESHLALRKQQSV